MAKKSPTFECKECGYKSSKWSGKCPNCGGWDTLEEISKLDIKPSTLLSPKKAKTLQQIKPTDVKRLSSNDEELDLVLGGGIVDASLVLIGGSPGVGKSTLLLKIASNVANQGKNVLYVSAEESLEQISLRAKRIGAFSKNLFLLNETKLEEIFAELQKQEYNLLIIDSIQTIYSPKIQSAPGSTSQIKELTFSLMQYAKQNSIPIFIIGHITKDGQIAGPRVLEHMVDTVLYFEDNVKERIRILRSFKNRFGSTSEVAIFEMTKEGLKSAKNFALKYFKEQKSIIGAAATIVQEGSRFLPIQVQALVAPSNFQNPKRSATGFELNRLYMILALLEKKFSLPLNSYDVFINIAGGIKITETSADLAIIAAILSSFKNKAISNQIVFLGEIALTGEVQEILNLEQRLKEAKNIGFTKAIIPNQTKIDGIKCYMLKEVIKLVEWI